MDQKKCPVCHADIKGKGVEVKSEGRTMTVCCDECAKKARPGTSGAKTASRQAATR